MVMILTLIVRVAAVEVRPRGWYQWSVLPCCQLQRLRLLVLLLLVLLLLLLLLVQLHRHRLLFLLLLQHAVMLVTLSQLKLPDAYLLRCLRRRPLTP